MSASDRYRLSDERNEEIFRRIIVARRLSRGEPQARPVAYLLGGQPGAGKSGVQQDLLRGLADRGGGVEIVGDKFRQYHPAYDQLMRDDDQSMATHTAADSGRWVEKSIAYAAERRLNMVIEGTMRNPEVVEQTAARLRDGGYRVEAVIVATPEAQSRLGILHRYQSYRLAYGSGRYTTPEAHDAGLSGVLDTADALDQRKGVDTVRVCRRDGTVLYQNHLTDNGAWQHEPATRQTIETERARQWSPQETATFDETVARVRDPEVPDGREKAEWLSPEWQSQVDAAVEASARNRHEATATPPAPEHGRARSAPPWPPDVDRVTPGRSSTDEPDRDLGLDATERRDREPS